MMWGCMEMGDRDDGKSEAEGLELGGCCSLFSELYLLFFKTKKKQNKTRTVVWLD